MASINFYIDRPDTKGRCPIFLVYQSKGRKFKHYTKEKILPKYWDKKKQRAKNSSDAPELNDILEHLASRLKTAERNLRMTKGTFSIEDVRNAFLKKKVEQKDFFGFCTDYLNQIRGTHQPRTIQKYQTLINDLKDFEKTQKTKLTFDNINIQFFGKFLNFLFEEKKGSQNTVAKKISILKTFLNHASKSGLNTNLEYKEFKVRQVKVEKIFLTKEELFRMYEYDFSDNSKLEKVRDVFCFGCFTGLRYSDIENLKFDEIITRHDSKGEEIKALKFYVQKTKQLLEVPLNKYAMEIIDRYDNQAKKAIKAINGDTEKLKLGRQVLPVISNQKTNEYIKEVAKIVGINSPISITKYIGAKRISASHPKHDLIATHTARRTFAILSLEQGMRVEVLQKILGHASINTTMKYVYILEEIKNQEMQKAWS